MGVSIAAAAGFDDAGIVFGGTRIAAWVDDDFFEALAVLAGFAKRARDGATGIIDALGFLRIAGAATATEDILTRIEQTGALVAVLTVGAFFASAGVFFAFAIFADLASGASDIRARLDAHAFAAELAAWASFAFARIGHTLTGFADFAFGATACVAIVFDARTALTE